MRTWAGAEHLKLHRCSLKMGKVHFYLSDHRLFRTSPLASGLQGEIMREENANEGPPSVESRVAQVAPRLGGQWERGGDGGRRRGFIGPRTSTGRGVCYLKCQYCPEVDVDIINIRWVPQGRVRAAQMPRMT